MREKIKIITLRYYWYILSLPQRLVRFFRHPFSGAFHILGIHFFILEWILLLFDLFAIPEHLENLFELWNWHLRPLNSSERNDANNLFGKSIRTDRIRLNPQSKIARKYHIAFVSFYTIHCSKEITASVFIHEVVHIWQFENFGSPYIIRALRAQRSEEGYDYGGAYGLYKGYKKGKNLLDYNYEQMAEIVMDGYLLKQERNLPNLSQLYNKYIFFLKNDNTRVDERIV